MHSIIQVLKEQPELSRKDRESNLVHCELAHLPRRSTRWVSVGSSCWEHQFQEEDNGTLRLCPRPPASNLEVATLWMSSKWDIMAARGWEDTPRTSLSNDSVNLLEESLRTVMSSSESAQIYVSSGPQILVLTKV